MNQILSIRWIKRMPPLAEMIQFLAVWIGLAAENQTNILRFIPHWHAVRERPSQRDPAHSHAQGGHIVRAGDIKLFVKHASRHRLNHVLILGLRICGDYSGDARHDKTKSRSDLKRCVTDCWNEITRVHASGSKWSGWGELNAPSPGWKPDTLGVELHPHKSQNPNGCPACRARRRVLFAPYSALAAWELFGLSASKHFFRNASMGANK